MFFSRRKIETKKWHWYVFLAIILAAFGLKAYSYYWPKATVVMGGQELRVLVADTPEHALRGLGRRDEMGKYDGMLFEFVDRGQHSMVMRDMRFPVDIVWLDNGVVVDIAPNVPVEAGKKEWKLTPYFARAASTRVLEFPAGMAEKYGLKIGDVVEIIH